MHSPRDGLLFSIATGTWPDISPFTTVPVAERLLSARLHCYQFDMLAEVARLMRAGYRRVLLQCPTGGGKTVCAESALGSALQQGLFAQFLVHRKELIKQTSKTFAGSGLEHSFVAAGFPFDPDATLILAGVQTLVRRLDLVLPPNLIIVDECHHATAAQWAQVLEAYPDAFILGLTATPERLDGRGLDEHFDVMVRGPSVAWLIENRFLSPYDFYAPTMPDMTGVPSIGGDFNRGAAAAVVDKPKIVGDIVEHYLRLCPGEQGIVFAASREHSRHIADAFTANGVPAMHVDGSMSNEERDFFDEAFRAGDIRIGVNVGLFGEGYDVPNISYVGDAAPTRSLINVLQRWGRALRVAPGKTRAVICDHAGNAVQRQLGLPDDEREWLLEGRARRARATGCNDDATPVRQCLICFRVSPSTVKVCPGCQTEFPTQVRTLKQEAGTLTKLEREMLRKAAAAEKAEQRAREKAEREAERKAAARGRKTEEKACQSYEDFKQLAESRGYENPHKWARMKMQHKSSYRRS